MAVVRFQARKAGPTKPAASRRWRARVATLLREPLLHFLVAGLLLFVAAQAWRANHDARRIVVTPERVADLAARYRLQFGVQPTRAEVDGLVESYVDEEVLYREGVARGLDRDDEIVRRRVAQKAQFLQQDIAPVEPSEAQLRAFFTAHSANYGSPWRYSFTHLYFSLAQGGETTAKARAQSALARLAAGAGPDAVEADAFPDLNSYSAMGATETARIFGNSPLVASLASAPVGRWSGPVRSAYGWHLVRVDAAMAARMPDYAEVKEKVRADYLDDTHRRAVARAMAATRGRYTVVREDLKGGAR